jgi:hypothetical protein
MAPSVSAIAIGPGNQRCQFQENARYAQECEASKEKCSLFSGSHDEDTGHRYLCSMFFVIIQKYVFLNLWPTTH